ncbi:MAG: hypothetical protein M0D53_07915 [Flavobacterium sp. JAD_PAG50586_2]|nr:MAG: hypothetical protein M0D53_07915 [Flavobacterium sp. JAD_PAG50586_2]
MKNALFGFISIVLFSLSSEAQENEFDRKFEFISGSVITTFNKEIIEYKFKSLEELNESLDEITKEFDFDSSEKGKMCEMKMEIKVELVSGTTKILVSEIVNTSCDNELLSAAANRLKSIALATRS